MADKDLQKEERRRAAESDQPDEAEAPKRKKKDDLRDLDVTDAEGGALTGGRAVPILPGID